MTFADLTDFLDDTGLPITLGEHEYVIPAPDAPTGIRLSAMANLAIAAKMGAKITEEQRKTIELDDAGEHDFNVLILSRPVYEQMVADGLNSVVIGRVAQYAFTHFTVSPEAARAAAEAGAFSGKAQAPNRAQRRAAAKPSTAAKSDRPAKAASSQTTTRKAPAAKSRGGASSTRGRS